MKKAASPPGFRKPWNILAVIQLNYLIVDSQENISRLTPLGSAWTSWIPIFFLYFKLVEWDEPLQSFIHLKKSTQWSRSWIGLPNSSIIVWHKVSISVCAYDLQLKVYMYHLEGSSHVCGNIQTMFIICFPVPSTRILPEVCSGVTWILCFFLSLPTWIFI